MKSSLRLSGPVMATEDGTLGAASLKEEAMQQGRSDFQSIPSTHFNLNPPLHDGIDITATVHGLFFSASSIKCYERIIEVLLG